MEKGNGGFSEAFFPALSDWVFRGDVSGLTTEMLQRMNLAPYAYLFRRDETMRPRLLALQAQSIKLRYAMQCVGKLLASGGIDFCPLKGADLAWRVWPDDVPRRMGDIDVLIRENERERALAMLKKDGWDAPYFYRSSHHEPQLVRKTARLEVHFRLPHFGVASTDAIWRKLRRVSPYEWQLSTEMNLLMLFCHSRGHRWKNAPQLLLDCGFLIRREGFPGWDRIDALAKEYALPSPAPFFAAFPDFFPEETRPEKSFPAELLHAFREVVTSPVPRRKDAEIVLAQSARFSLNWWKRRFAALHPSVIRLHTCNPHGHYGKLTLGYFQVNFRKLRDFARYIFSRRDRELKQRLQTEDTIEKFLR